jgi:DNA mismatch repair protein MutS2
LQPGQRVRLESGTVGDVLEQRPDGKIVVRVGSLKVVVDAGSLTLLPGSAAPPLRGSAAPLLRGSAAPLLRGSAEETPTPSSEIDLRGLTGDEAEQNVELALDRAVLAEQPYLRIIHGKGTGVVRERVQQVLRRDRRVRAHGFAPANQGGTGVTVVELAP